MHDPDQEEIVVRASDGENKQKKHGSIQENAIHGASIKKKGSVGVREGKKKRSTW